eukprot:COSAG04_NODE_12062_length_673_cov_0.681185_2_plen_38_part_01
MRRAGRAEAMASPKWEWLGGKEPPPALSSPTAAAALDL